MTSTETKYVCGIDLGTTYSCVGVMENGKVDILANDLGSRTTPSWVSFSNERLIGEAAKSNYTKAPETTIFDIKRLVGQNYSDSKIEKYCNTLPYKVVDKNNKPYVEVNFKDEKKEFSPEQISAMILEKMKSIAEASTNSTIKDCVITVPGTLIQMRLVILKLESKGFKKNLIKAGGQVVQKIGCGALSR